MPAVSDVPDPLSNPSAALTRRQRRDQQSAAVLPRRALMPRPLTIAATVAFASLVALTGYASPSFVALAVALGGLVLAWGWPVLLSLPSPRGSSAVLAAGTVLMSVAVIFTTDDPFLRWLPAAMAVAVVLAFLHQLMRRDGRPRLTESVAATVAGLAVISSGVALAPLPHVNQGEHALAAAMAGLGVSVLADPLIGIARTRQWALFVAMLLGGGSALAVSLVADNPRPGPAALLGLLAAAVAHAARRVMVVLPAAASPRAQLAIAAAASLLSGVMSYVVVRYFIA
jgi:hypothetical protein